VLLLGVRKAYRGRGLEALLIDEVIKSSIEIGMGKGELSWILEDNIPMRKILEKDLCAEQYRTYRIYQKDI
jgi:ribosomal protein S18 acetylase RimI-like enzyme